MSDLLTYIANTLGWRQGDARPPPPRGPPAAAPGRAVQGPSPAKGTNRKSALASSAKVDPNRKRSTSISPDTPNHGRRQQPSKSNGRPVKQPIPTASSTQIGIRRPPSSKADGEKRPQGRSGKGNSKGGPVTPPPTTTPPRTTSTTKLTKVTAKRSLLVPPATDKVGCGGSPSATPGAVNPSQQNRQRDTKIPKVSHEPPPQRCEAKKEIDLPPYRRNFGWADSDTELISPAAEYTKTAPPLPKPPQHLLDDVRLQATLKTYQSVLRVETPFNVDELEKLTRDHPNQPFVKSVLWGLRNGFWPFDRGNWTIQEGRELNDFGRRIKPGDVEVIRATRDKEMEERRWSEPIPELLPGMRISPLFVNRANPVKPRVITDHASSGLNDSIPKEEAEVLHDTIRDFGQTLHDIHRKFPRRSLMLYKSDVASAFLHLPMHPLYQLRQVVKVDDMHIIHRLVFGNRASPRIWCALSGLLCWIAINKFGVRGLFVYMDDFYGWEFADKMESFHGQLRPQRQVNLLKFWDRIRCPYEDKKQLHGSPLEIIGYTVDINRGTICMSSQKVKDTKEAISTFVSKDSAPLSEWQKVAGQINWILDVLPIARPALDELHRKMSAKGSSKSIYLNKTVKFELTWLTNILPYLTGVSFFDNVRWEDKSANMTMYCDATQSLGISFHCGGDVFIYRVRKNSAGGEVQPDIFFMKQLGVLFALYHASTQRIPPKRLVIHCDDASTVRAFGNMSAADAMHTAPLLSAARIAVRYGIDFRVRKIEKESNTIAGLASCLNFTELKASGRRYQDFIPQMQLLSEEWCKCF